jgi:hypothetical protein
MMAEGKLANYGNKIFEYYNLMVSGEFLPKYPYPYELGCEIGAIVCLLCS